MSHPLKPLVSIMPRNNFHPTDEQRKIVQNLAGIGMPQDQIASLLDICKMTLVKYFRPELTRGDAAATAKVAETLYKMATNGQNVAATIFWMKARAKWSERLEHSVTVENVRAADASDDALAAIALRSGGAAVAEEENTEQLRGVVH